MPKIRIRSLSMENKNELPVSKRFRSSPSNPNTSLNATLATTMSVSNKTTPIKTFLKTREKEENFIVDLISFSSPNTIQPSNSQLDQNYSSSSKQRRSRACLDSGFNAAVSSIDGNASFDCFESQIDDGLDIDKIVEQNKTLEKASRKTGKWRKKDDVSIGEWDGLVEMHKNSTPKKVNGSTINNDDEEDRISIQVTTTTATSTPNAILTSRLNSSRRENVPVVASPLAKSSTTISRDEVIASPLKSTSASQNVSPLNSSKDSTPKRSLRIIQKKSSDNTPLRNLGLSSSSKPVKDTPNARKTRRNHILSNEIQKVEEYDTLDDVENVKYAKFDPESDSDTSADSGSEDGEHGDEENVFSRVNIVPATNYKDYFQELHDISKLKTSDNTLDKLPSFTFDEYLSLLQNTPDPLADKRKNLLKHFEDDYHQWKFELLSSCNLLFYGFGSKKRLLNDFSSHSLDDGDLLVINGFFPNINLRDVLSEIILQYMKQMTSSGSIQDISRRIANYYNNRDADPLYLLIHNIDGPAMRQDKIQECLSILAGSSNIHLVCSVDHFNAVYMYDSTILRKFNFVFHDITTFERYSDETSDETYYSWIGKLIRETGNGGKGGDGGNISLRAALYVLNSLTAKAKDLFKKLANHQIEVEKQFIGDGEELGEKNGIGWEDLALSSKMFYDMCSEKLVVSSYMAYNTQLREFLDHQLIIKTQVADGSELLYIPFQSQRLRDILDQME